jgi:hypothetical protein
MLSILPISNLKRRALAAQSARPRPGFPAPKRDGLQRPETERPPLPRSTGRVGDSPAPSLRVFWLSEWHRVTFSPLEAFEANRRAYQFFDGIIDGI